MDSQAIALLIAAGGLVLGLARLVVSILAYRLDSSSRSGSRDPTPDGQDRPGPRTPIDR